MRRTIRTSLLGSAVAALLGAGCLYPAEDRAERDREIGSADAPSARVRIEGGLAAISELSDERLVLWQSAPLLRLTISVAEPRELELHVENTMPGAILTELEGTAVTVSEVDTASPTEARYRLRFAEAGSSVLRLGEPDAEEPAPFRIGLMSDVQEAVDTVGDIYARVNREDVRFLLGAGDLTERGTLVELREFKRQLRQLEVPYYTTLGNHELGVTPSPYQDEFGRGNFTFVYRGARFSLLDSASATIDPLVYEWLEEWLELGKDSFHVVAMHIPPVDPIGVRNGSFASRNEADKLFVKLLEGDVDLTLYGHLHSYFAFENAGIPARVSGGGGAIPERFDHIGRHFLTIDIDPVEQTAETRVVRVD